MGLPLYNVLARKLHLFVPDIFYINPAYQTTQEALNHGSNYIVFQQRSFIKPEITDASSPS